MKDRYIVFDVETPNCKNDRMSAIGVCVVEDKHVVDEFYTLVNPETTFNKFNIQLTKITPQMVVGQRTFAELWQDELKHLISNGIMVAHNAPFDMGVLSSCIHHYGVTDVPRLDYACTVRMSRQFIPNLPNHKLNTICDSLHIDLDHHNAGSDACAAAEILIYCMKKGCDVSRFTNTYLM